MQTKAEKTSSYIIEMVAPIFNQKGYVATTLSDVTEATGLTKGAIYGNFESKEALALAAFTFNVKNMLRRVDEYQSVGTSALEKLFLATDFYRHYYVLIQDFGGCPILNMGVSTKGQHPEMYAYVQFTVNKIIGNLEKLLIQARQEGEIMEHIDANAYAKHIYTQFQGAIFMTQTMEDPEYLKEACDQVDVFLKQLKKQS